MNITLTPEIEQVLIRVARKQGATVESIVLKTLRECFFQKERKKQEDSGMNSLADMLKGDIGTIDKWGQSEINSSWAGAVDMPLPVYCICATISLL